jgi:hypothetical protein
MKAIVFEGKGQLAYKDVETPGPVRVRYRLRLPMRGSAGPIFPLFMGCIPGQRLPWLWGMNFQVPSLSWERG